MRAYILVLTTIFVLTSCKKPESSAPANSAAQAPTSGQTNLPQRPLLALADFTIPEGSITVGPDGFGKLASTRIDIDTGKGLGLAETGEDDGPDRGAMSVGWWAEYQAPPGQCPEADQGVDGKCMVFNDQDYCSRDFDFNISSIVGLPKGPMTFHFQLCLDNYRLIRKENIGPFYTNSNVEGKKECYCGPDVLYQYNNEEGAENADPTFLNAAKEVRQERIALIKLAKPIVEGAHSFVEQCSAQKDVNPDDLKEMSVMAQMSASEFAMVIETHTDEFLASITDSESTDTQTTGAGSGNVNWDGGLGRSIVGGVLIAAGLVAAGGVILASHFGDRFSEKAKLERELTKLEKRMERTVARKSTVATEKELAQFVKDRERYDKLMKKFDAPYESKDSQKMERKKVFNAEMKRRHGAFHTIISQPDYELKKGGDGKYTRGNVFADAKTRPNLDSAAERGNALRKARYEGVPKVRPKEYKVIEKGNKAKVKLKKIGKIKMNLAEKSCSDPDSFLPSEEDLVAQVLRLKDANEKLDRIIDSQLGIESSVSGLE